MNKCTACNGTGTILRDTEGDEDNCTIGFEVVKCPPHCRVAKLENKSKHF